MNPDVPHKAIVNISFSIYPVDSTGELKESVHRSQLQKDGLKHRILDVKGNTYQECVVALKNLMEKILQCNKN